MCSQTTKNDLASKITYCHFFYSKCSQGSALFRVGGDHTGCEYQYQDVRLTEGHVGVWLHSIRQKSEHESDLACSINKKIHGEPVA